MSATGAPASAVAQRRCCASGQMCVTYSVLGTHHTERKRTMFTFDEIENFEDFEAALEAIEDEGLTYDEVALGVSL